MKRPEHICQDLRIVHIHGMCTFWHVLPDYYWKALELTFPVALFYHARYLS